MIRYKLRTLLLTTALVAATAGYFGKRVSDLSRNREACEKLGEYWLVNINQTLDGQLTKVHPQNSKFRNFIDWPARKFLDDDGSSFALYAAENAHSLWLYETKPKKKSLEGLERFQSINTLRLLDLTSKSEIEIEGDEFRHIAKLKNLEALVIRDCHVNANGLAHLQSMELENLVCGSKRWTTSELDEIGKIKSLRKLSIDCRCFDVERIQGLKELTELSVHLTPSSSIRGIEKLTNLDTLLIWGWATTKHFSELKHASNLKQITFRDAFLSEGCIEYLLAMEGLESVNFIESWPNLERLEDSGLKVKKSAGK